MKIVDRYLQRAKLARTLAASAPAPSRPEFETIAQQWELLAQERLRLLETRLRRGSNDNGADEAEA
jgi:hypothetical protein